MRRPFSILVLCIAVTVGSSAVDSPHSRIPVEHSQEHVAWVGHALEKMLTIQPGMTRKELLTVFTREGGLSTGLRRTYVSQECPYFKVDVEFEAVGRPDCEQDGRVTLAEDDRDVIVKISQPYLQFGIMD